DPFSSHHVPIVAVITGGGIAQLTDPDGQKYSHQFEIAASVKSDGSASGEVNFVFSKAFSLKFGGIPGVSEIIHLKGDIKAGSIDPGGSAQISGPWVETDYAPGHGEVYKEGSRETGYPELKIVIAGPPNSKNFTLTWCNFIPAPGYFSER